MWICICRVVKYSCVRFTCMPPDSTSSGARNSPVHIVFLGQALPASKLRSTGFNVHKELVEEGIA